MALLSTTLCQNEESPTGYDYAFRKTRDVDIDSTLERVNFQRRKMEAVKTRLENLEKAVAAKFQTMKLFTKKYLDLQRESNRKEKELAIRKITEDTIKQEELKLKKQALCVGDNCNRVL